jgi:general secretion pathway protein J
MSPRGFTLVEVLVALAAMAMLAVMAWRGIDAMGSAQAITRERSEDVLALQAGLAQWRADLDAVVLLAPVGGVDFDGRVLRITRHSITGDLATGSGPEAAPPMPASSIRVVAWGARQNDGRRQWLRWQSAPVRTRDELQIAWQQAALWGQNPSDELRRQEVAIAGIDAWQVFYFRNDSWSSPLSSAAGPAGQAGAATQSPLPDGVRLVLTISEGQVLSGRLQQDWVRPTYGAGRS